MKNYGQIFGIVKNERGDYLKGFFLQSFKSLENVQFKTLKKIKAKSKVLLRFLF
jgi:hypothetical protein